MRSILFFLAPVLLAAALAGAAWYAVTGPYSDKWADLTGDVKETAKQVDTTGTETANLLNTFRETVVDVTDSSQASVDGATDQLGK